MAEPQTRSFYEFRCWPEHSVPAIGRLHRDWRLVDCESRNDIYLLPARAGRHLIKLRGGYRLDIKHLVDSRQGCQLWEPLMAHGFPLPAHVLRRLGDALGLMAELQKEEGQSPAHLVAALTNMTGGPVMLSLKKARASFEQRPIRAEITHVTSPQLSTITLAVEAAEAPILQAAIKDLGLEGFGNTDYGAYLRRRVLIRAADLPHQRGAA